MQLVVQRGVLVERKPESRKPWERANVLVAGLGGVIALVVALTQQRPASAIAVAVVLLLLAVWFTVRTFRARFKSGRRKFPRGRWVALVGLIALVVAVGGAFVLPGPRQFLVGKVLGVPLVAQNVKIAQVRVLESATDYELAIAVLNTLTREELVNHIELRTQCPPQAPQNPVERYKIRQNFDVRGLTAQGRLIAGGVAEPGNEEFAAEVTGDIDNSCGGISLDMTINAKLPPNQHADIRIDIPRTLVVPDDSPRPLQPGQAAPAPATKNVPFPKPGRDFVVKLTVGGTEIQGSPS